MTRAASGSGVSTCPELAAIKLRRTKQGWVNSEWLDDLDALLRMVDELTKQNDPIWDATDGAHPAWWRGHDHAAAQFAKRIQEMNVAHTRLTDDLRAKLADERYAHGATKHGLGLLEAKLAEAEALAAKNDARAKLLLADREAAEARVKELELAIRSVHADKGVIR